MAATALDHLSLGGRIDWLAQLDTAFQPAKNYRRTSIVRAAMAFAPPSEKKKKKRRRSRTRRLISSCVNTDLHNWPKDQLRRGLEQAPNCGSQRCPNVSDFGPKLLPSGYEQPKLTYPFQELFPRMFPYLSTIQDFVPLTTTYRASTRTTSLSSTMPALLRRLSPAASLPLLWTPRVPYVNIFAETRT